MNDFGFAALVGMTIGLTEAFKFKLEGNAARALGVAIGFVLGLATELVKVPDITVQIALSSGLYGLMIGLTSVGLYHATTATAKKLGAAINKQVEVVEQPVAPAMEAAVTPVNSDI